MPRNPCAAVHTLECRSNSLFRVSTSRSCLLHPWSRRVLRGRRISMAFVDLGAAHMIPVHYDTFAHGTDPEGYVIALLRRAMSAATSTKTAWPHQGRLVSPGGACGNGAATPPAPDTRPPGIRRLPRRAAALPRPQHGRRTRGRTRAARRHGRARRREATQIAIASSETQQSRELDRELAPPSTCRYATNRGSGLGLSFCEMALCVEQISNARAADGGPEPSVELTRVLLS